MIRIVLIFYPDVIHCLYVMLPFIFACYTVIGYETPREIWTPFPFGERRSRLPFFGSMSQGNTHTYAFYLYFTHNLVVVFSLFISSGIQIIEVHKKLVVSSTVAIYNLFRNKKMFTIQGRSSY